MKLIDILVQELPKLGGWPNGIDDIEMLSDGTIYFNGDIAPDNYKLTQCSDGWSRLKSAKDYSNAVTREQYEAALAASKPEWDGRGLPPVGTEAEVSVDGGRTWCSYHATSEHNGMRLVEIGNFTEEFQSNNWLFRPIRSEADKKRGEIIEALKDGLGHAHGLYDLMQIYHLLNNGKIPHIRID
ncbi:TPA: hypothetical protein RKX89_000185 [Enterobacter ludwigii]|nr:hypothetical protein [Enterobacter ludwigii]